ncbi:MAG: PhzF family phenazine biosynthesis protein [Firmicutes bacterium]|nr:PhzF family phenazine biosynthesis protein [Bacillota bacterium]
MKGWLADAFATAPGCGNRAAVVLFEEGDKWWEEEKLQAYAAEQGLSETVYLKKRGKGWRTLYYTPNREIELCGHGTIAAFAMLRQAGLIGDGEQLARTRAGIIDLNVAGPVVWMDMAPPRTLGWLSDDDADALYAAYGLSRRQRGHGLKPEVVTSGVADVMAPVADREALAAAVQDEEAVLELSKRLGVVGVHMFCPGEEEGVTAHCRNFAPLYGIPEESATGTSNGALTWYLYTHQRIIPNAENLFLQGESMGKPSRIHTCLLEDGGQFLVQVGGEVCLVKELEL